MYDDDDVMDIIEERERELKERKRLKALKLKEAARKQVAEGKSADGGRQRKSRAVDSDEEAAGYDSDDDDDEPTVSFGAGSSGRRPRRKLAGKKAVAVAATAAAGTDETEEMAEVVDEAATTAKMEEAMKKAVAAQKPRRQLPKMDVERLLSDKGLNQLLKMAERFKIKEKASTLDKLNELLALYQLWSHNMCPSMAFADVVRRVETLGSKRPVQNFMRKVRLGENPGPWNIHVNDSGDENAFKEPGTMEADETAASEMDEANFDDFLSQALDEIEQKNNGKPAGPMTRAEEEDEDLVDLDAFLDNLHHQPVREELL